MILKAIVDEDFVNYKLPSMVLGFPNCTMKCNTDAKRIVCHNHMWTVAPNIEIPVKDVIKRYMDNPITKAVVCSGLEPLDSLRDLLEFIIEFRIVSDDPIVIYSGYTLEEVPPNFKATLTLCKNIILKTGRYIPNGTHYFNEILGVELASNNQQVTTFNLENDK